MRSGGQSVTGLASGTPANAAEAYAHEFALTLSTTLTCDIPLPLPCQSNDDGLNSSQWDAFRVSLILFFRTFVVPQRCLVSKLICSLLDRQMVGILRLKLHFGGQRKDAVR